MRSVFVWGLWLSRLVPWVCRMFFRSPCRGIGASHRVDGNAPRFVSLPFCMRV
jgi:hypothetical protein